MKETRALFNAEWENPTAELACLIACYTEISTTTLEKKKQMNIKETIKSALNTVKTCYKKSTDYFWEFIASFANFETSISEG